jgi:steroid delta-isomerase-like uncharacterized protein
VATTTDLDLQQITERYFAAWEQRDPDAIAALHAEDTQFWMHSGGEPVRGREAVRAAFADVFARFEGFGFDVHRVLLGDAHWVLDWTLTATAAGRPVAFDCVDVVTVDERGLVARKDTFVDSVQAQAALGTA